MDHPNIQTKLPPELIPKPTYWPFMLAVSLLFMGWGVISYWIISLAGTLGFFFALRGWIKEIIDEG